MDAKCCYGAYYDGTCCYRGIGAISEEEIAEMMDLGITELVVEDCPILHNRYFIGNLDNLFEGLESLSILSYDFNEPINNLSSTLKILKLNCKHFNQDIDILPQSLEYLSIKCRNFNKSLDYLPNLKELHIESYSLSSNLMNLPPSLEILTIILDLHKGQPFTKSYFDYLPSLKTINLEIR